MLKRLPTKLDGVVLLEPTVHGDERGFMVESYRHDLWDDPDVGVEWPVEDPLLSERDKAAPTLAEVGETLPF